MKRLSQTWQQKKSGRGQENVPPGVSREKDGSAALWSVRHKTKDATKLASNVRNSERRSQVVISPHGTGLSPQSGSFNLSFGFEFDAAALSQMDKMERSLFCKPPNTGRNQTTTPINNLQKHTNPCTPATHEGGKSCSSVGPTAVLNSSGKGRASQGPGRGRISTPKDDSTHVLVSPSVQVPMLSPVNAGLLSSKVLVGAESLNSCSADSATSLFERPPSSSPDACELTSWGLPPAILQAYHSVGITHMFEWQAQCLRTGNVLQGGNLVYSAPTSAGKTLVAELLMLKRVLETRRKALLILPFVSVAREKMFFLQRLFQEAGVRVGGYMGSHVPAGGFASVDVAVCTIEKANSLLNRLMDDNNVASLGIVVVDELHLIGDPHRGYLLELFLTKVLYLSGGQKMLHDGQETRHDGREQDVPAVQIVGMSATLPNLEMLARWLSADLYSTDHRPVPLTEMIKVGTTIYDNSMQKIRDLEPGLLVSGDSDHVIPLCRETVADGHSVLVFCPTKSWCEKLSETIAKHFAKVGSVSLGTRETSAQEGSAGKLSAGSGFVKASSLVRFDHVALQEVLEQLRRTPVGLDSALAKTVPQAVAFHHAGLTFDERDIIEGAFRGGAVRVLVATSTLSSGVNLPARRVIIRTPIFHSKLVDPLVYKQMAGRAGRKGVDSRGESVLLCKPSERHKAAGLLNSRLRAVRSCLAVKEDSGSMQRALLEVIASGVAPRPRDVERYAACTFFASSAEQQEGETGTECAIKATMKFLVENEFVRLQPCDEGNREGNEGSPEERYVPSQLGVATLASALCPREALVVFAELQRARKCFVLESELHVIYQVTPIYLQDQWPTVDWYQYLRIWEGLPSHMRRVADLVGVQESFLARGVRGRVPTRTEQQRQVLGVHRRFFAALALQDLVREAPLHAVASRYGVTKGMLQSLQSSAATFAGMVTVFCQKLGWTNLELLLSQFQSRLSFGIQRELCDLVRISLLNASRARMLYDAGYHTVGALASTSPADVETVLRNAAPFVSGRRRAGETEYEVKERCEARVIWVAGKRGLTERDAARMIVEEAQELLRSDVAQLGVEWKPPEVAEPRKRAENADRSGGARSGRCGVNGGSFDSGAQEKRRSVEQTKLKTKERVGQRQRHPAHGRRASGDGRDDDAKPPMKSSARGPLTNQVEGTGASFGNGGQPRGVEGQNEEEAGANGGRGDENKAGTDAEKRSAVEGQEGGSRKHQLCSRETDVFALANTPADGDVQAGLVAVPADPLNSTPPRASLLRPKVKRRSPNTTSGHDAEASDRPKLPRRTDAAPESAVAAESCPAPEGSREEGEDSAHASEESVSVELYSGPFEEEEGEVLRGEPSPADQAAELLSQGLSCSLSDTCLIQCDVMLGSQCSKRGSPAPCKNSADNIATDNERCVTPGYSSNNRVTTQVRDIVTTEHGVTTMSRDAKPPEVRSVTPRLVSPPSTPDVIGEFDAHFRFPATGEFHARRGRSVSAPLFDDSPSSSSPALVSRSAADGCPSDLVSSFSLSLSLSGESEVSANTLAMLEVVEKAEARLPRGEQARSPSGEEAWLPGGEKARSPCEPKPPGNGQAQSLGDETARLSSDQGARLGSYERACFLGNEKAWSPRDKKARSPSDKEARSRSDKKARSPSDDGEDHHGVPFTKVKKRTAASKKVSSPEDVALASQTRRSSLRSSTAKKPRSTPSPETADIVPATPPTRRTTQRNLMFATPSSVPRRRLTTPSPLTSSPPTSPSQDTLSTIDVTADARLFAHFLDEWRSQARFAIAVACERAPHLVPKIGGRFNNAPTCQGPSKGLKIEGSDDELVGVAVCWGRKDAYFVSLQNDDRAQEGSAVSVHLPVSRRLQALKTMLESAANEERVAICFDFKEHFKVLARACGISLGGRIEDPKVASWLLDPGTKEKNLHQLVGQHLAGDAALLEGSGGGFGTGGLALTTSSPMGGRVRACVEVVLALKLAEKLKKALQGDELSSAFEQVEMPVLLSLVRMELNGFGLCEAECETLKSVLKAKLRMLEGEAYRLANRAFSLTSLDDVAHVLFVELRLPHDGNTSADVPVTKRRNLGTNRRSATSGSAGNRKLGKTLSTNKEVLERLKRLHPLPAVILEWRRVNCALCKVVFPLQKEKQDCARLNMARIHCSSQLHTATGRVSFTEPNLQNVPKDFEIDLPSVISDSQPGVTGADVKSKRGRRNFAAVQPGASCSGPAFSVSMRNAFIPFTGGVLLAADYSQLELRLITHLADDPRLRRILNSGGDVFKMIAGEMSGIPAESVSDGQRQRAKQICYGIIYGIGARSLAEQLGVHEDEATVFIENFKSRFSVVRKYLEETIEGCRACGYVRTITKRRRYLPAITSANAHARAQAERQAVNTTVQGSAADLMKKAMIKIDERLVREFPACIQTHGHKQEGSVTRPRARRAKPGGQKPEGGYMVLQLHDELIFETSERDLGRVARIVKEEMEGALELCVPLPVKMKAGPSWGKMTSYDP